MSVSEGFMTNFLLPVLCLLSHLCIFQWKLSVSKRSRLQLMPNWRTTVKRAQS